MPLTVTTHSTIVDPQTPISEIIDTGNYDFIANSRNILHRILATLDFPPPTKQKQKHLFLYHSSKYLQGGSFLVQMQKIIACRSLTFRELLVFNLSYMPPAEKVSMIIPAGLRLQLPDHYYTPYLAHTGKKHFLGFIQNDPLDPHSWPISHQYIISIDD